MLKSGKLSMRSKIDQEELDKIKAERKSNKRKLFGSISIKKNTGDDGIINDMSPKNPPPKKHKPIGKIKKPKVEDSVIKVSEKEVSNGNTSYLC